MNDIHQASRDGDVGKVKTLLEENPDLVFNEDSTGNTALHVAAQNGHKDVAELLLANRADVNAKTKKGITPLHEAAEHGHKIVIELLLANKADVNAKTSVVGQTPLHVALNYGRKDVAEFLLASGADANAKDNDGETPLHYAVMDILQGRNVAELLLANGAEINAQDKKGHTPLRKAADKGWPDVAELLRQRGGEDTTATIHDAARSGDLAKVVALLKNNPDLVFSKNKEGVTPLHEAAACGRKDIAQLLLVGKAEVDAKDNARNTSLHFAARNGHKDLAEVLLANGADVNAKDIDGETPLLNATWFNHRDLAEMLLANKANVNAKSDLGSTPLHNAAQNGNRDLVKLLLANKADINAKTNFSETPLQFAQKNKHEGVAELLRQHDFTLSVAKDESLSFEALVEELVQLSQQAFFWGLKNGFPDIHPQDTRAKQLGELIYAKAGFEGMQEAARILRRRVVTRDGGGQCFLITYNWQGIGNWHL